MSNNLIPIFNGLISQEEIQLVNAQSLHQFLEVETRFNDWISRRISEYQFVENADFILVTQKRVIKTRGGDRRSKDYHLTLDMAKELSMVERTEKGRQARKYFIECEKRLTQILKPETITTEQKYLIRKAVNERSYRTGEHHQSIYHKLYDYFKINSYEALPATQFDNAIKFLGGVHIKSSQFTDDELCTLSWCYKAAERMRQHITLVTDALYQIKSEYAPSFYSMGVEYKRTLENTRVILDRETKHIELNQQGYLSNNWRNVLPNIRQNQIY